MSTNAAAPLPLIDRWTLVGLSLLLLPLLTMAHELGGHALSCVALGQRPSELGAYYIECPGAVGWPGRLVAMAGTGMDVLLAVLAFLAWRRSTRPLPRLALWIVFVVKGMVAAGYWLFSGVSGFGDWGPGEGGGIGPLPAPWLWRIVLTAVGLVAYIGVVKLAIRSLGAMLGGGEQAARTRRQVALTVYIVGGVSALLVGLLNPHGIVITLLSAVAASFGGTAGLFNVAYGPVRPEAPAAFRIARHPALLVAGLATTLAFALVLGPTLYLH
ncbi:hypothetical protein [Rhodanobacter sp. PCA2]|uniref:hypothetical protein n=1 Tax=Rhodanobacter sp. PCA2 TaxID=2006117 RepID=UPI0015E72738|nr:hypothetical protein [Rhodanobacter sp. PCA2]MBA2077579.1 hypothetical protein [Rhodanobacter sp. PCA2]